MPSKPERTNFTRMTTVAEVPPRRRLPAPRALPAIKQSHAAQPAAPAPAATAAAAGSPAEAGSFFITEGGPSGETQRKAEALASAQFASLRDAQARALESDEWAVDTSGLARLDVRSAVHALKHALDRPSVEPSVISAHHLRTTEAVERRKRGKHEPAPSATAEWARGRASGAAGVAPPGGAQREGPRRVEGALEDMSSSLAELQQRVAVRMDTLAVHEGSNDPEGDACMASMVSMLSAMDDMHVGHGAAPLAKPEPA